MTDTLSALTNGLTPETVQLPSGGGTVVAHLYLPQDRDDTKRYPAVAIGGSFSSVKEQMGGIYGAAMARRGVIGLAIDYRNYGQSSGAIRQYEDPESKAADLSAALAFLRNRADVAGAGLLGICSSGTAVIHAAADDHSVGAVGTVVGAFVEPSTWTGVERRLRAARAAQEKFDTVGAVDFVPAYHPISLKAVNTVPMPYYLNSKRGRVPQWRNEFAVMAYPAMYTADAMTKATKVTAPVLSIHTKLSAGAGQVRKMHDKLAGPKELRWSKGQHFSFYDHADHVRDTADQLAAHFVSTLG